MFFLIRGFQLFLLTYHALENMRTGNLFCAKIIMAKIADSKGFLLAYVSSLIISCRRGENRFTKIDFRKSSISFEDTETITTLPTLQWKV